MAFRGEAAARGKSAREDGLGHSIDLDGWEQPDRARRDWKKLMLVIGLGTLSWVATYIGMLELIQSNMGDLSLGHKAVIGFSVAMLMTMIIWLLDQMFAPIPTLTKLSYVAGYIFLTIISVGFGFGFYWKVLESRSEASRSAESAVGQVQTSLHAASTRLTQLSTTLEQLTQVSTEKAAIESAKGTSCPNSRPGDGPRRKLRDEDAQRFGFAAELVKGRVGSVKSDLSALDADLARIASADPTTFDARSGTRNEFMKQLGRKLDMTVTGFNAFRSDPQLRQIRADLADRADRTSFPDGKGGTFSCPDVQLQTALKGVVGAIDQLPVLTKPEIATVEGSEATVEAFRRLTATFYGMLALKLPPSADELRELQKKAVQSVESASPRATIVEQAGLSKRDYIPLAIAVFVDLCLLLVSMGRPVNRLHSLVPKMRAAERGPVIEILSRFNEIHRDPQIRESFELFRHVVFDHHGAYYVAVPLDAPARMNPEDREALRLEAHLLANLFTSFEKEKIFTRVLQPMISTKGIRKKLWRQGSKFAQAEAFRVYKFRDGAWSEMVLGAVMGAARRAESGRRLRAATQDGSEPSLTIPGATTAPAGFAQPAAQPTDHAPPARPAHAGARHAPASERRAETRPVPPEIDQKFGIYARSAVDELSDLAEPDGQVEIRAHPAPARHDDGEEPSLPVIRPAEVAQRAANSNTSPRHRRDAGRSSEPRPAPAYVDDTGKVIVLPGIRPQPQAAIEPVGEASCQAGAMSSERAHARAYREETIDVVLRRETATLSVPVSEAALPQPLTRLLAQRIVTTQALPIDSQLELALPSTQDQQAQVQAMDACDADDAPHHDDKPCTDVLVSDISEDDVSLARRFAPPAAE